MLRIIVVALLALLSPAVVAAPFVACDVAAGTTHTAIQFCSSATGTTCNTWGAFGPDVAVVGTECRHDVAGVPVGQSIARVKAIGSDPVWGRQESAPSAPFVFTRPAAPTVPGGTRLVP